MSNDKVKEVAEAMRRKAGFLRGQSPEEQDEQSVADWLDSLAARLSPRPEPEKPMRYWLHLAGTSSGYGAEIECRRQTAKPGIEWIEFHPADAPHCDKAEHAFLVCKRCGKGGRESVPCPGCEAKGEPTDDHCWLCCGATVKPRCDVEGHLTFEGHLRRAARITELAALLDEAAVDRHQAWCHADHWDVCPVGLCARVRAALGGK
jgi:hypothetical protein